jgi:hypothetical protein
MIFRHVASGELRDLDEEHSATIGWVAAGVWEPVVEASDAEVVETPEKPAARRAKVVEKKETR